MRLYNRYVGCPSCRVQYPVERLYSEAHDRPADGKQYTISCVVCGHQFDVLFRKRWFRRIKAIIRG